MFVIISTFMGIFSSSKKKEELVAIFDIGSSSVSGALALVSKNNPAQVPKIIATTHTEIPFQEDLDFGRFLELALKSLENSASALAKAKRGDVERVHCFFASPWYASQTRVIRYSKTGEFVFTKKLAEDLVSRELKAFESAHVAQYADIDTKVEIIESRTFEISLNGYRISNPFGKRAKEAAITMFVSVSPKLLINLVIDAIYRNFHISDIEFHSFGFASFIALRDMNPEEKDFIFLDIGGEITDVLMVRNDILHESVSFPSGKNSIARRISKAFNRTSHEAFSLFTLAQEKKLESSTADQLHKILSRAEQEWVRGFEGSLNSMKHVLIPDAIYVLADDDVAPWFAEAVKKEEFSQYMRAQKKFNVIILNKTLLRKFCFIAEGVRRDPFLMLESVFINRLENGDTGGA